MATLSPRMASLMAEMIYQVKNHPSREGNFLMLSLMFLIVLILEVALLWGAQVACSLTC